MITVNVDGVTTNMKSFKTFIAEALPPHLQKHVDNYNAKLAKFKVTDVTPEGYGPDESPKSSANSHDKRRAQDAGKAAFKAGKDRVPPTAPGYDVVTKKEWIKGWDMANLAEPIDESTLEEATVEELRAAYSSINGIDPESPAYTKLTNLLDKMDQKTLKTIVDAKIKFVSSLALNRIKK